MSMISNSPLLFSVPMTAMMQPVTRGMVVRISPTNRIRPESSSSVIWSESSSE